MQNGTKFLSVIVPAYKQAPTIKQDICQIKTALSRSRYPYEIIVVIDGDNETYACVKKFLSKNLSICQLKRRHGKGYAVRYGMKKARGDYISFIDAGMEIDPNGISMLMEHLEWYEADIIVGSKRHPASMVDYSWDRRILSFGYQWLVKLLFSINIKDTQPGLKIFRRDVLEAILPVLLVKEYAFDIEMLSVAYRYGFKRIFEAPIKLKHKFGNVSNAATLKAIWHMLYDTTAVFYRLKVLHYYDKLRIRNYI